MDVDFTMSVSEWRRIFEIQKNHLSDEANPVSTPLVLASPRVPLRNIEPHSLSPGHAKSLHGSPVIRITGRGSPVEADAEKSQNASDSAVSLLQAPTLPERSYSSNGRLEQSNIKAPPPVPSKSSATMQKFKALHSANTPRWSHPEFSRIQSTNSHLLDDEDRAFISMVDNDLEQGESLSPRKQVSPQIEEPANAIDEPGDPFQHAFRQATNFSTRVFGNVQNFVTTVPPKPPKPAELGRKISQTVNPMLSGAKENLDKVVLVAKPVVTEVGRGLEEVRVTAQTVLDETGVTKVFEETQDDLSDAAAKISGKEGLCSKCQALPATLCLSGKAVDTSSPEHEWTTPLSRIIYHADWCRVCHLLQNMLCEPGNDPLKHPAVAPYVQEEISGWTMRDWIMAGWVFNDACWPFGLGEFRHEGASYLPGPSGQKLGEIFGRAGRLATSYGVRTAINPRRSFKEGTRDQAYREKLKLEREKQNRYPLSCVVKITTRTQPGMRLPGMLFVSLYGYGRKVGADLQILSSFKLRATSSKASSDVDNLILSRTTGSFSYGRLLDSDWIDPSVGRLWLRECESRHGFECNKHGFAIAMQKPGFLRVIDVEKFCVKEVAKPAECRFIALSYVWGGAKMIKLQHTNMEALMSRNGLLPFMDSLPQTIVDAIEVVHAMGERHLWVDSLCILQDDVKEAKEQIACMDRVYGSALATIIAAQGMTAHSGLEGVRQSHVPQTTQRSEKKRSLHQVTAEVKDDISLIAPLATADHNVDASAWNARAWTFQERLLSRRLIVFTHGQIIWHCRKMICREDMTVEDSNVSYPPLQWLSLKPRYLGVDTGRDWIDGSVEITRYGATQLVRSATFAEYVKAVEQYTSSDELSKPEQCLYFWASSSTGFHLGEAITQESDRRWNVANPRRRHRLLDADSEVVGNVLLDGADDDWFARERYEFVQLAEAQYSGLDNEFRDIEDCPLYLMMFIEWNERRNIAYRLGLGRVQKTAWMLAAPKLKLVCLG
ncbi:hypothetical protein MMC26_003469 [Xylographa opegraphella]|nr:hypothetical protein [Xylographa opegraphella]